MAVRRGVTAALWGAGIGVLVGVLDLAQSLVADPGRLLPLGAALVLAAVTIAGAVGAALLALLGHMPPRRAALGVVWLAAVALTVSGAADLLLTTTLPKAAVVFLTVVGLVIPVVLRGASVSARAAAAWGILLLLVGARQSLGIGCLETHDRSVDAVAHAADVTTRPNVVLMVLDTLRADHLSGHGYPVPTTPTLDALAAAGLSFPRTYTQATWTTPATASILTSLYPSQHHHGAREATRLSDSVTTLPEVLRGAGYETAAFSANGNVVPENGFAQGFETFGVCDDPGRGRSSLVLAAWKWTDALTAWLTGQRAPLRFISVEHEMDGVVGNLEKDRLVARGFQRWLDGRDRGRPFFAYLHLMSPHVPYDPSPESRRQVGAPAGLVVHGTPRRIDTCFARGEEISADRRRELIAVYDAGVRDADGFVAAVLARLARDGLDARTMLVVMADHGEEFYEHGNWGHGQSLYEELTRIPLVIRRPGGREAGRRHEEPVMAVDVMPTILAETGVVPPPEMAGRSLLDRRAAAHDAVVSELVRPECNVWALVREHRKYLEWRHEGSSGKALYDLDRDPGEQAAVEGDGTQELALRLEQHRREAGRISHEAGHDALNAQQEDRLRALGYIR